jgi:RimJ/RimL family protein N-acetyltransferase
VRQSEFNKGYATEISNALTRYAFDALNAKRVEIFHADGNVASQKIPLKLGFMKEAVLKNASPLPNGDVVDKHIYARTDANGLPPLQVTWF